MGLFPKPATTLVKTFQFWGDSMLKQKMPASRPGASSAAVLPTPEKHDLAGSLRPPGRALVRRRNDVETRAQAGEEVEDGEVGIGLDGVADQGAQARRVGGDIRNSRRRPQGGAGIDVAGCRNVLAMLARLTDSAGGRRLSAKAVIGGGVWSVLTSSAPASPWRCGRFYAGLGRGSGSGEVAAVPGNLSCRRPKARQAAGREAEHFWTLMTNWSVNGGMVTRWTTRNSTPGRCGAGLGSRPPWRRAAPTSISRPGGGILEVEFADGSKIIINRHGIAKEIWVAARAGGFHFAGTAAWSDTRDGTGSVEGCSPNCRLWSASRPGSRSGSAD